MLRAKDGRLRRRYHQGTAMNLAKTFQSTAVALCMLFVAAVAHGDQRDDETHACKGDALKLCSSEIPNEEKITACMKQHVNELSPQCRVYFVSKKPSK